MNKDLIHCLESMSDSLGQISNLLDEMAFIIDQDNSDDFDYDDIEDDIVNPDIVNPDIVNPEKKGWQLYDKAIDAIYQGTGHKAIMLTYGYIFDPNDSIERVLEYVNKDIDNIPVEFVNDDNGIIGVKSIIFKNITGMACAVVVLNEVGLIAFYEMPGPTTFDGIDFAIVTGL
jgi:hypothetical protein